MNPFFESSMREALRLAEKGRWKAVPNPCVGAVLVQNGEVVAKGWHRGYGKAHVEMECLNNAKENGVDPSKCTLVVTLEPCNHWGKTPPCTKAILDADIKHVVIGVLDPNSQAAGGIQVLREAGVHVEVGILEQECRDSLADFFTWQEKKRPYVILKMATSIDGRIAPRISGRYQLTNSYSLEKVMQMRYHVGMAHGAVLVGAKTFYTDNPKLTVRNLENPCIQENEIKKAQENIKQMQEDIKQMQGNEIREVYENVKQAKAVLISSSLPENMEDYYLLSQRISETYFYTKQENLHTNHAQALQGKGLQLQSIPQKINSEYFDLKLLLEDLFLKKIPYVLCEGGPRLATSLLQEGLVDELHIHMAPIILGDSSAKALFDGRCVNEMKDAMQMRLMDIKQYGTDCHITYRMDA